MTRREEERIIKALADVPYTIVLDVLAILKGRPKARPGRRG